MEKYEARTNFEQTKNYSEKNFLNKPIKNFKAGAISASIWENKAEKGTFTTITLNRSYKDSEDKWKSTNVLRVNDLPKAELVLRKAYEFSVSSEE